MPIVHTCQPCYDISGKPIDYVWAYNYNVFFNETTSREGNHG